MSELRNKKQQRSELLQQLAQLRIEIKDEAEIDLNEKWDLLQSLPPQFIKIGGLGRGFDTACLNSREADVYSNYKSNCLKLERLISEFKNYYQTEDHKNIVRKLINQVNEKQTYCFSDRVKRILISNIAQHKKTKNKY